MLKCAVRTRRFAGVKTTNGNSATCAIAVCAVKINWKGLTHQFLIKASSYPLWVYKPI